MLVVMRKDATDEQIHRVVDAIRKIGLIPHPIPGSMRTSIGVTGNIGRVNADHIGGMAGVLEIIHVTKPFKLTSREMIPEQTVIEIGDAQFGEGNPVIIAGPCAVESYEQMTTTASAVAEMGADMLRGGAFKPRTSPYSFQGMGLEGLKILNAARMRTGLPVVSEALDIESFPLVERYVDVIQIGARNMQNFELLRRAGRSKKPVLLKRGISATINEFLLAAEYVMSEGNYNVILCERGIRTYSNHSRFTLDIGAIPELRSLTHLPIIVDPSHAAGKRSTVIPLARASLAVGSDGLIIEVHPNPAEAVSDGPQSLTFDMFREFMSEVRQTPVRSRLVKEVLT